MYGLVNRGIAQLIQSTHGHDVWESVLDVAGIEDDVFLAMEPYDDKITFDLVEAVTRVLGVDAGSVLEAFGEHWVQFTARLLLASGSLQSRTLAENRSADGFF